MKLNPLLNRLVTLQLPLPPYAGCVPRAPPAPGDSASTLTQVLQTHVDLFASLHQHTTGAVLVSGVSVMADLQTQCFS